eukprot:TRINITY_DN10188_c0_g1_i1.p1 TRINITY_DN10188_c0_g1~~TRINITY_DN10188_c0_g1_i1.p1  ORF type:complete len:115 (+),score=32.08 TRINITY_DN10188_c0_g1_i1:149-493(+)
MAATMTNIAMFNAVISPLQVSPQATSQSRVQPLTVVCSAAKEATPQSSRRELLSGAAAGALALGAALLASEPAYAAKAFQKPTTSGYRGPPKGESKEEEKTSRPFIKPKTSGGR